jgi:hypothetical protein
MLVPKVCPLKPLRGFQGSLGRSRAGSIGFNSMLAVVQFFPKQYPKLNPPHGVNVFGPNQYVS